MSLKGAMSRYVEWKGRKPQNNSLLKSKNANRIITKQEDGLGRITSDELEKFRLHC